MNQGFCCCGNVLVLSSYNTMLIGSISDVWCLVMTTSDSLQTWNAANLSRRTRPLQHYHGDQAIATLNFSRRGSLVNSGWTAIGNIMVVSCSFPSFHSLRHYALLIQPVRKPLNLGRKPGPHLSYVPYLQQLLSAYNYVFPRSSKELVFISCFSLIHIYRFKFSGSIVHSGYSIYCRTWIS